MSMTRSYRDEWNVWGFVTALQSLLMYGQAPYTTQDILTLARCYGVEEDLLKRMSYVPDSLEHYNLD